jgi:hypothetical protein
MSNTTDFNSCVRNFLVNKYLNLNLELLELINIKLLQ